VSQDSNHISDLNAKITAIQAKTAVDNQQALDFAHHARIAADERKDKQGT